MYSVLLVEDDISIAEIVSFYLTDNASYCVTTAYSAEEALVLADKGHFDIMLLDIMLPGMDGVELCKLLRNKEYCPIIFISCIDDEESIINALRMGGDDYLVKPFNCNMLLARMEANLRRISREQKPSEIMEFSGFSLNSKNHTILRGGEAFALSPIEYHILSFMISSPNEYFTLEHIYEKIWGKPSLGDVRTVMVHMHNLRKKIEEDHNHPQYLLSARGKGYMFRSEPVK